MDCIIVLGPEDLRQDRIYEIRIPKAHLHTQTHKEMNSNAMKQIHHNESVLDKGNYPSYKSKFKYNYCCSHHQALEVKLNSRQTLVTNVPLGAKSWVANLMESTTKEFWAVASEDQAPPTLGEPS